MADVKKLAEELVNLKVTEVNELATILKEEYGIEPAAAAVAAVVFVTEGLPRILIHTDFDVDYGLWGVMLPVLVYFGRGKWGKLALFAVGVSLLGLHYGGTQWWGLLSVPLLALYNGKKGTWNIGPLFYWYYPAHLVVIYGLSLLLERAAG